MNTTPTQTLADDRPRINAIAGPILGEFLLGYTVAIIGLWLASHASDGAAGTLGLANQVLETLFVVFRVLAIGMGVATTQLLGGQQHELAKRTALSGLGACTWAGLFVVGVLLLGNNQILDLLNAPDEILPLAALPAVAGTCRIAGRLQPDHGLHSARAPACA